MDGSLSEWLRSKVIKAMNLRQLSELAARRWVDCMAHAMIRGEPTLSHVAYTSFVGYCWSERFREPEEGSAERLRAWYGEVYLAWREVAPRMQWDSSRGQLVDE